MSIATKSSCVFGFVNTMKTQCDTCTGYEITLTKMTQFQKYVFLLDEIIASRNSDNSLLNFQSFPVHFLAFPESLSKTDQPFRVQGVCSHVLPRGQRSAYVLPSTADIGLILLLAIDSYLHKEGFILFYEPEAFLVRSRCHNVSEFALQV